VRRTVSTCADLTGFSEVAAVVVIASGIVGDQIVLASTAYVARIREVALAYG